jgi:hypothetical protein
MDLNLLKAQVSALMLLKSSPEKGSYSDLWMLIGSVVLISGVEYLFRNMTQVTKWCSRAAPEQLNQPLIVDNDDVYSVTLVRNYEDQKVTTEMIEKVDAVIEYISNLETTKHVALDGRYSIANDCEIEVTDEISAKVHQVQNKNITEVALFSDTLTVPAIRRWIDKIHEEYIYEKSNRLGHRTFYFAEIPTEPPRDTTFIREEGADPTEIRWRFDNAPKTLAFNMNEFQTSKSFSNVYGSHVSELRERLSIFVDHPEWYEERGIPHTLGIMLHGIPGAGKTSTIKAIAKDTGRHIFSLALRPYTTCKQLTSLFYDETVHVTGTDGTQQTYRIPLNKRVYVIEDIDCLTDIVLERSTEPKKKSQHNELLTLSFLLNLLDGVLETPGRILVITSNYPERIDKALIRPGRIDVKVEFKHADKQFILDMLNHFYECDKQPDDIPTALADRFTPAEVMEAMAMHFKDPDAAITHLKSKVPAMAGTTISELLGDDEMPQLEVVNDILPSNDPMFSRSGCPWSSRRLPKVDSTPPILKQEHTVSDPIFSKPDGPWSQTVLPKEVTLDTLRDSFGATFFHNIIANAKTDVDLDKINTELLESHKRATREIIENPDAANGLFPEDLLVDCNAELPDFELDPETRAQLEAQFASMAQDPKIRQIKQVNDIVKYIGETGSRNSNYEHANVQTIRAWFPDATLDTIAWALECVEITPHGHVSFKHPYDVR